MREDGREGGRGVGSNYGRGWRGVGKGGRRMGEWREEKGSGGVGGG